MGICAGVWVCGHVYIFVCIPIQTHLLTALSLYKYVCGCVSFGWLFYSPILNYLQLLISSMYLYVCVCVCILFGDLGVWSTQSMNKWRALAVGTEVFAKSEDPSSLWTHPAVPLSLSLSAETKTLADQATLIHITSARAPRDGHGVEGWRDTRGRKEGVHLWREGNIPPERWIH